MLEELPLLALPTLATDVCNDTAVFKLSPKFFAAVLNCTKENDPLKLLQNLNGLSWNWTAKRGPQFYRADFTAGCKEGELKVVLYQKDSSGTGEWDPVRVTLASSDDRFTIKLHFDNKKFLNWLPAISIKYTDIRKRGK